MKSLLFICLMFIVISSQAQIAINIDGSNPDNSAMLDVKSTTKGLLAPRMTFAERNAIVTPATGLLVFQTNNTPGYYYNSGTPAVPAWVIVGSNAGQWQANGNDIYYNLGKVGIGTATPTKALEVAGNVGISAAFPFVEFNSSGATDNIGLSFAAANNYKAWMYYSGSNNSMIINAESGGSAGYRPDLTIKNTGNVGIGGEDAAARLHVFESSPGYTAAFGTLVSSFGDNTNVSIGDSDGPAILYVGQSTSNKGFLNWGYNATPENANFQIGTYSGANPLLLQPVGGNVGIGAGTPVARLHVAKYTATNTAIFGTPINEYTTGTNVSIGDNAKSPVLYIGQSNTNKGFVSWNYNTTPENAYFQIGSAAGNNPLILQIPVPLGGNVGIGTIAPQARLEVKTDDNGFSRLGYFPNIPNYFYHSEVPANGDGQTAIYAYRTHVTQSDGVGYQEHNINSAIHGFSYWGDLYSFGTAGFNYNDFTRCGGILGAVQAGTYWGSLGYKNSAGTSYGGYFTSYISGTGKSTHASIGIGIGAWGDLMGADIHGKVYGIYAEGENYATYSNGPVYKNDIDVHLQENGTAVNTVLYTNVSTDVTVQTCGYATLSNGKTNVDFNPAFLASVSKETPVVVTVTPIGNSNGVYLSEVTHKGFKVVENNDGKSNITVSYIAIGNRLGYEHPVLAQEVIDATYVKKMSNGLHNDADTQTNGEGLYYENGKLAVGIHPSTLPDPNKPAEAVLPIPAAPAQSVINPNSPSGVGEYSQAVAPVTIGTPVIESPTSGSGKVQPIQQIGPINTGKKDWNVSKIGSPKVTPDKVK